MDKYQKFVLEHLGVCISVNEDLEFNKNLAELINSDGELEIRQNENYNIKKHFIYFKDKGEQLASIKIDGKTAGSIEINGRKYPRAEVDFDKPAKEIKFEFADGGFHGLSKPVEKVQEQNGQDRTAGKLFRQKPGHQTPYLSLENSGLVEAKRIIQNISAVHQIGKGNQGAAQADI